ncbi:HNH endonuclease signature motif containing protein [Janthinobacterium sp. SUN026]|uniref:HNH endonuclease signature motif containing protein n=1 Tax=Janthinobacterium sp. SUN026 TaxID=3002438 RepID=UPI0025B0AC32|nr:HNH endonuclease signature motif containing protein [Janthinobacterium sp. SUN026]MDN2670434.1 HNH endonuclease signature motif containing protein [Janthinobacterium sp. SUN026]
MSKVEKFLQYGVASDLAQRAITAGLTVTSTRAINQKNLIDTYGFNQAEAKFLKQALMREEIPTDTLFRLLDNSNYICNICKGGKGVAYVVHHIEEYEISKDNGYANLIVLCPNDHDLAHSSGLTLGITKDQLKASKNKWEATVKQSNKSTALRAVQTGKNGITSIEILPQLMSKYKNFIRSDLTSVAFVQSLERCYIEITTTKNIRHGLEDEISMRTDLGFITGDITTEQKLFSPAKHAADNALYFVEQFDVVSIINCTDLFTPEASRRIDEHWRMHGALLEDR